ncbi:hypothetical protein [Bacillus sp. FJAT-45350]|uniref:hypothetical protein n=1 Tax=Bacillus sp. FJAT-45350 TaxID=2011014 RepID=UPI000BB72A05|nr:hypothetical protein [Bacillus sp. FJAT-45350]
MKKTSVFLSAIAGTAAGATAIMLKDKDNRKKLLSMSKKFVPMLKTHDDKIAEELPKRIGHPDPHDYEDNSMVDEGSIYSIQYYNEKKEKQPT